MGLVQLMSPTKTSISKIKSKGGFFYFLCDSTGANAAIMALDATKDSEGKKSFRDGRGLMKEFKKEFGKPKFSQGRIEAGKSSVTLVITKGNAKPAQMMRAFKKKNILHEGVGTKGVALFKSAKIIMDSGSNEQVDTDTKTKGPSKKEVASFANREDIKDLGLTTDEVVALMTSERTFSQYESALPSSSDELTEIQELQAATEQILDELKEGQELIEKYMLEGNTKAATQLHLELNDKRIDMARKNATGPDPFLNSELDGADKEALNAALYAGIELLRQRVEIIKSELKNSGNVEPERRAEMDADLLAVRFQLEQIRPQ
jgi:hypothetical protein